VKYFFILFIFATVAGYAYWRLRPYLRMVKGMLGMVRDVRGMQTGTPGKTPRCQQSTPAASEKLVRCASCETWLPSSRAVTLRGSSDSYCSHSCLEHAADAPRENPRHGSSQRLP